MIIMIIIITVVVIISIIIIITLCAGTPHSSILTLPQSSCVTTTIIPIIVFQNRLGSILSYDIWRELVVHHQ